MSSQKKHGVRLWGVFMLLVVGALGWFTTPVRLEFGNDVLKDLSTMFGYLILISLFVERTIEVFLSAWRSQGADELDFEINNKWNYVKENIDPSIDQQSVVSSSEEISMVLKKELEELEKKRILYSARSRFIAQWFGLGIGMLVSLVGVRVLGNILDISSLTEKQEGAFIVVDIILTGAVLAGGSEAINKVMKIYNDFMNSTAEKVKTS